MNRNIYLLTLMAGLFLATSLQAQEIWTLERCITHAYDNNLNVKQGKVGIEQSTVGLKFSESNRLPGVSGSLSTGVNFGRSIDPTTNDFVTAALGTGNLGVSVGGTLYNGGRINNSITQSQYDLNAAKFDLEQTQYDVALVVAQNYLSVLLAEEQLVNAQANLRQIQDQLAQTNKLIAAGSIPENDRLDIEAQIATNEQIVIAAQNSVDLAYLNLKLSLLLEPNAPFRIERPEIEVPSEAELSALKPEMLIAQALQKFPSIQAGEMRRLSADKGIDIAKSALYPTVSVFGSMGTNVSSIGVDRSNPQIISFADTVTSDVLIDGSPADLTQFFNSSFVLFPEANVFQQIGSNLNQGVGLSVSIPIYSRGQTKLSIQQAELQVKSVELANEQVKQNIKSNIIRALADAKAASKQYLAAEKTVRARDAALKNVERRLNLGAANTFEYATARNNLDAAKANLILAKYDYIFKVKILDYYQGRNITLD